MFFRKREKLFRKTMSALALDWSLVIGRVPNALREIPARINATPRAVENWLQGRTKPNCDNVVYLMAEFPEVADAILEVTDRKKAGLTHEQRETLLKMLGDV